MEVAKGDTLNKLIVGLYVLILTRDEQQVYLETIKLGMDPRILPFWKNIKGLYPPPKLTPKTREVVEKMLKEQINAERKTV